MADPAQKTGKPATYEDLLQVPDRLVAQVIDGDLVVAPRPAFLHGGVANDLAYELGGPFQRGRGGPGGWWICSEPELHPGADILVPDLAGWRRERMPVWPAAAFATLRPDWVCEILSPSTSRIDRGRKLDIYAREGVPHAWLIDPLPRTLEAFALDVGRRWVRLATYEEPAEVRAAPFDAVPFALSAIFRTPPAPTRVSEITAP
jgi:Uma2 family endonuclease